MVVYQALYGDYGVYVRPYEMFVSKVDRKKYPDAAQTYRFERVLPEAALGGQMAAARTETMQEDRERRGISGLQGASGIWGASGLQGVSGIREESGLQEVSGIQGISGLQEEESSVVAEKELQPNPVLLDFLDAQTYEKRMEFLKKLEKTAVQADLDSIYTVLDMKPAEGSIEDQLYDIRRFLAMQNKYDGGHLR